MNRYANEAAKKLMADVPGLTVVRLAELANVSTQTASRWLNDRSNAPPRRVALAAQNLGLDPRDYGLVAPASTPATAASPAIHDDVRRIQRQLDLLLEYHRRGDDHHWLQTQPNP